MSALAHEAYGMVLALAASCLPAVAVVIECVRKNCDAALDT